MVVLNKDGMQRFNKIINPPKPENDLTIKTYMERREEALSSIQPFEKEYQEIEQHLRALESIDYVKEYIELLNKRQQLKDIVLDKQREALDSLRDMKKNCNHPLWAVEDGAVCVICGTRHRLDGTATRTPKQWQQLIDDKKLIASIETYYDEREDPRRESTLYRPKAVASLNDIRKFYLKMYNNQEELKSYGLITDSRPLEDLVWEYFCNDLYKENTKSKIKSIGQIKK